MEIAQEREWAEAQKIVLSVDMVPATKRHLQFLAAVDKTGDLYNGPALLRAVHRYKACWLPLLAKHTETPLCEESLVVPLDCEWIWHCHRLNPLRYISDCKDLFGRILDNRHVISSVEGQPKKQTEEIWGKLFPEEPYELDFSTGVVNDSSLKSGEKSTDYDLVSAVERTSSFYRQVSRPHMSDDLFLKESVARYRGFLHLMKKNMEDSAMLSCVPTYDIDLIWHTHQLHPLSYCNDLMQLLGKVVEHDDTDSDQSEGSSLNVGFKKTTQQWEEMFGRSYWRAGAMYKGIAPKGSDPQEPINAEIVEVMVEVNGVKSLPKGTKREDLFVSFNKKQPDMFFTYNEGVELSMLSKSGEKEAALFWCEPTGELLFELKSRTLPSFEVLGSASLSLTEFFDPVSELSMRKWIELAPGTTQNSNQEPIFLHVAVSFTPPTPPNPEILQMTQYPAGVGGGSCSGKCSGKCTGILMVGVSGGGGGSCSGKCSGKCTGVPAVAVAVGGACAGGGGV